MISLLPNHENECQQSVNTCWTCMMCNQGIVQIFEYITELLTALTAKNANYTRRNTDSNIIDIANFKSCKMWLHDIESLILVRHYYHEAKTRALYEYSNGPVGQQTDNPRDSDKLEEFHRTVSKLMILVYSLPGLPIWPQVSFNPDPDWKL